MLGEQGPLGESGWAATGGLLLVLKRFLFQFLRSLTSVMTFSHGNSNSVLLFQSSSPAEKTKQKKKKRKHGSGCVCGGGSTDAESTRRTCVLAGSLNL